MSIFSKKTTDQKAEQKAQKKQRKEEIARRDEVIRGHLGKMEKISNTITTTSAAEAMDNKETVITSMTGQYDGKNACMVCTDRRIIIAYGIGAGTIELPYTDIDRVDTGRRFSGSWVTLHNGSQATTLGKSSASDEKVQKVKNAVREQQETSSEGSAPSVPSVGDLTKLAELHAAGVLTDAEFTAAKAKALGL